MILIVDDKPENILSLRRTLELAGFEVEGAESGEEALRKILKQDYSLIILDVQMPGMDGFEVAETFGGISKMRDVPIIFLSAVSKEKKFITKGYKAGAVDYLVKPVDPDVFILKVQTLIRLYEQNRELNAIRKTLLDEVAVRRKAEANLAVLVEELRTTLHSIPQIAFTLSAEGKLEFYNEHWEQLIGEARELPAASPEDKEVLQRMKAAIEAGIPFEEELSITLLPADECRCHLLHLAPVKDAGKILKWVGTLSDVHERKTANERLEAAVAARTTELSRKAAELEASNSELQQFVSVASHDLKEPLRKLQIFGSILQKRIGVDAPQFAGEIDKLMLIAGRMGDLISDLLNYSRLSADGAFQLTDLSAVVGEVVSDFDFQIKAKGASVSVDPLPVIDAISGQMRQLFQNLISNALKFNRPGIAPQISITAKTETRGFVSISITDNGIGFDETYLGKIFTIFQRLHPTEVYEGTGIGLAIVKKIVEKHGGAIAASSREGAGATFVVSLPASQEKPARPSAEAAHSL